MSNQSSELRYGLVAVLTHWATAALIIALLASGFKAGDLSNSAAKAAILRLHVPMGIAVLLLTLFRIAWWLFWDSKPRDLIERGPLNFVAKAVHWGFYVLILVLAGSGIGMFIMSGAGQILFGGVQADLPNFWNFPPRGAHGAGATALLALLAAHIGGTLYHQFLVGDRIFARMGVGRIKTGEQAPNS